MANRSAAGDTIDYDLLLLYAEVLPMLMGLVTGNRLATNAIIKGRAGNLKFSRYLAKRAPLGRLSWASKHSIAFSSMAVACSMVDFH